MGSEMCIRDSPVGVLGGAQSALVPWWSPKPNVGAPPPVKHRPYKAL